MKKSPLLFICAVICLSITATVMSATYPHGRITAVNIDGTVVLDAGMDAGFETGDILVVQRDGKKVALAHVTQLNPNSAVAKIVKSEPEMQPKVGDVLSYQLLMEVMAAPRTTQRSLTDPLAAREPVADVIRDEWKTPLFGDPDLDSMIETQRNVLDQHPSNRAAMIKIADAYFQEAWFENSIRWFQKAIEQNPKAQDNDKLIYQIIRCLGFLNQPEKQALYIEFLNKYYPNSVFSFINTVPGSIDSGAVMDLGMTRTKIIDSHGFQKGGMRYVGQTSNDLIGVPGTTGLGGKLLNGSPDRIAPQTYVPTNADGFPPLD